MPPVALSRAPTGTESLAKGKAPAQRERENVSWHSEDTCSTPEALPERGMDRCPTGHGNESLNTTL